MFQVDEVIAVAKIAVGGRDRGGRGRHVSRNRRFGSGIVTSVETAVSETGLGEAGALSIEIVVKGTQMRQAAETRGSRGRLIGETWAVIGADEDGIARRSWRFGMKGGEVEDEVMECDAKGALNTRNRIS